MKTYLLPLIGIALGGVVAFLTFALLFNAPIARIFPETLLPLALAALASFILARMEPKKWKVLALSVALPTILMAALLLIMLWMEDRGDWSWVLVAGATLCACMIPGCLAGAKNERD